MAAVAGSLFGAQDPTYSTAVAAVDLGAMGFLIGIALLVGGLVQSNKAPVQARVAGAANKDADQ
jgi:hypothetical protein